MTPVRILLDIILMNHYMEMYMIFIFDLFINWIKCFICFVNSEEQNNKGNINICKQKKSMQSIQRKNRTKKE